MPKSKRVRIVPTSKTKKDRKELVRRLHSNIQSACDQYDYIWVFEVNNVRNSSMKDVRSQLSDSRYAAIHSRPSRGNWTDSSNVAEYFRSKQRKCFMPWPQHL